MLPGIQALFGFQLIVVFNETFQTKLSSTEKYLHLVAIALIVISIALLMAPTAYHRLHDDPEAVSESFIILARRLLLTAMFPLMFALGLEFLLIANVITNNLALSVGLAVMTVVLVSVLWFVLPRSKGAPKTGRSQKVNFSCPAFGVSFSVSSSHPVYHSPFTIYHSLVLCSRSSAA